MRQTASRGVTRASEIGFSLLLTAIGLGLILYLSPLRRDVVDVLADPFKPPPPPGIHYGPVEPVPTLTEAQKSEAFGIINATPQIQQFLVSTGVTSKVEEVGPWHDGQVLLGAAINVRLSPPQTIEADWPFLTEGPNGEMIETSYHHKVRNLGLVGLLVDLQKDKVVEIALVEHDGFEDVIQRPDYDSPPPPDGYD